MNGPLLRNSAEKEVGNTQLGPIFLFEIPMCIKAYFMIPSSVFDSLIIKSHVPGPLDPFESSQGEVVSDWVKLHAF